uniref:Uncharacterized protein n=1 Tax=Arundo donax TaxID=35708 RepID=A0A0A9E7F2_ARUDO
MATIFHIKHYNQHFSMMEGKYWYCTASSIYFYRTCSF